MANSRVIDSETFLLKEDREYERILKASKKLMSRIPDKLPQSILYIIAPIATLHPVKLGITLRPNHRLCQLQIGNWHRLDIYKMFRVGEYAYKLEQYLHQHLQSNQLSGEWFDIDASDADRIVQEYVRKNINLFKKG